MKNEKFDKGNSFDFGKTSKDYSLYRDIYPPIFYQKIIDRGLCVKDQKVLDLGTGTGVIPRNLYRHGASFIGVDISGEQIAEARRMSGQAKMDIEYIICPVEHLDFPDNTFDVVTACQCFQYFDPGILIPRLKSMLKPSGMFVILFMAWLPREDKIAYSSEQLVLKYNPCWTGADYKRKPAGKPEWADLYDFIAAHMEDYDVSVPFTRQSWTGSPGQAE